MSILKWGKMSKPTPPFLKGLRNYCMKAGTALTTAAGVLTYYLLEQSKTAPVPDIGWTVVYILGISGIVCSTVLAPFIQAFYFEDNAPVSKK